MILDLRRQMLSRLNELTPHNVSPTSIPTPLPFEDSMVLDLSPQVLGLGPQVLNLGPRTQTVPVAEPADATHFTCQRECDRRQL